MRGVYGMMMRDIGRGSFSDELSYVVGCDCYVRLVIVETGTGPDES
jgi:hypothetical protein